MGEQDFAAALLDTLISFGKAQFGDAVKAYWVYDGDLCPCCLKREIDAMKYKAKTPCLSMVSCIGSAVC